MREREDNTYKEMHASRKQATADVRGVFRRGVGKWVLEIILNQNFKHMTISLCQGLAP